MQIDWTRCADVERVPGRMSGDWVIRDTRIPVDAVIVNARNGYSPEELTTLYQGLDLERLRRVLKHARIDAPHPV